MGVTVVGLRVFTHSCCRFRYHPSLLPGAVKFRRSQILNKYNYRSIFKNRSKIVIVSMIVPFNGFNPSIFFHYCACACKLLCAMIIIARDWTDLHVWCLLVSVPAPIVRFLSKGVASNKSVQ